MAKKATRAKYDLPPKPEVLTAGCRACGRDRELTEFRVFRTRPELLYMDFCGECEKREGTVVLYRRYNAYGTQEIIEAVFAANRVPVPRRTPEQVRLLVEANDERPIENSADLLQREMARRELARRRLIYYTTTFQDDYLPGWVHQDICRRLEKFMRDVEEEKSPRLIIAMPPRHGKSSLASENFPAWVLGHHPDWPLILASYAQELPVQFSRNIRDRLNDPEHHAMFPKTMVRSDAKGVEAWKTSEGGGIKAIGVGGGLTGFGGKILIADDLIKDAEAAASETILKNTWEWYQMVFRSRVAPGGGILLIGTRWHWNDPTGKALQIDEDLKKAGVPDWERENWEVVSYPAIAEHDEFLMADGTIQHDVPPEEALRQLRKKGEALHPERYPLSELKKIRNNYTASNWSALYQQNPTPEEGDFFKKDDIQYRWLDPAYRPLCKIFLTVDYAITKKQRSDFTVMGVHALDAEDNLYTLEIRRGRWGTDDIARNVVALVLKHNPELYAGEQGQIHHAVWPVIEKALAKERKYISVDETLVPIQDKETRARPLQGRMQRRKHFFSFDEATKPEIYEIAQREMLQFPNGVNDDIVDMLAWAGRLALNISLPNAQTPPRPQGWKEKLQAQLAGSRSYMAA